MERLIVGFVRCLLLAAMLLGALAYACRNSLGTTLFARALGARRGLLCNQPEVVISASLTRVRVGPLRCQVSEGPVKAFETGEAQLRLLRLRIREAHLDSATVDYHDRDVSRVRSSAGSDAADVLALRPLLVKSMLDASEMYSLDAPEISVNKLTARREGHVQLVMYGFRKTMDGVWNRSQAERVECPTDARATLRDLDMRVLPRSGTLSAALHAGATSERVLKLEGRQLDGLRPRFSTPLPAPEHASAAYSRTSQGTALPHGTLTVRGVR
jgi:hypothetical protein